MMKKRRRRVNGSKRKQEKRLIYEVTIDPVKILGLENLNDLYKQLEQSLFESEINTQQMVLLEIPFTHPSPPLKIAKKWVRFVVWAGIYPSADIKGLCHKFERQPTFFSDPKNPKNSKVLQEHYVSIFKMFMFHSKHHDVNYVMDYCEKYIKQYIETKSKESNN